MQLSADLTQQVAAEPTVGLVAQPLGHLDTTRVGDEWLTPVWLIDLAREILGGTIHLDPMSSDVGQSRVRAELYHTKDFDSLRDEVRWHGSTLWLNPPYSTALVRRAAEKLRQSVDAGHCQAALCLVQSSTSALWYQGLCSSHHFGGLWLPRRRIQFDRPDGQKAGANRFDSSLILLARRESPVGDAAISHLRRVLSPLGLVYQTRQ